MDEYKANSKEEARFFEGAMIEYPTPLVASIADSRKLLNLNHGIRTHRKTPH